MTIFDRTGGHRGADQRDALRDAIADLRREVERLESEVPSRARRGIDRARDYAGDKAETLADELGDLVTGALTELRRARTRTRRTVRAHPGGTIAVLLGLGLLATFFFRR